MRMREYLLAIMAVCWKGTMPVNAGDQTTKILVQNNRCNENLPDLVSTVISTAISQYLFKGFDKTKYDLMVLYVQFQMMFTYISGRNLIQFGMQLVP